MKTVSFAPISVFISFTLSLYILIFMYDYFVDVSFHRQIMNLEDSAHLCQRKGMASYIKYYLKASTDTLIIYNIEFPMYM